MRIEREGVSEDDLIDRAIIDLDRWRSKTNEYSFSNSSIFQSSHSPFINKKWEREKAIQLSNKTYSYHKYIRIYIYLQVLSLSLKPNRILHHQRNIIKSIDLLFSLSNIPC